MLSGTKNTMAFFTQVTNYLRSKSLSETFSITTPNFLYINFIRFAFKVYIKCQEFKGD